MLYKDYVETKNLANVLHQLELCCYTYKPCPVDKYRSVICEILLSCDPDGSQDFLFQDKRKSEILKTSETGDYTLAIDRDFADYTIKVEAKTEGNHEIH